MGINEPVWVPDACTLPTAGQPLRITEFDELLGRSLRGQTRLAPTRLRWELTADSEATARDLAARETACCAFFNFTFTPAGDALRVDIDVPVAHTGVLDTLQERATRV